jgi:hypothetical protein
MDGIEGGLMWTRSHVTTADASRCVAAVGKTFRFARAVPRGRKFGLI